MNPRRVFPLAALGGLLIVSFTPTSALADVFVQTNLVSSVPGLAASTDPNLINPWGLSFSATSPFWVADQGSGLSTLYDGAGNINSTVVAIPGSSTPPSGPTGTVQNPTTGFLVGSTPAHFIFDTLNGTIAAWASGSTAVTEVSTPGAVYTGLALATTTGGSFLYAANSAAGTINVFNSSFAPTTLAGNFTDPNSIAGYVPYNIQLIGTQLYVTYAELGPGGNPVPGSTGYVDVFTTTGIFVNRLASGGVLDAPWGIVQAPSGFGSFSGDILVGNFGNGEIDAYSTAGIFEGTLDGTNGLPIVNQDLWALDFRTGGANTNPDALYFTAGIDDQTEGLFGELVAETPEPAPILLCTLGLLALTLIRRVPQRQSPQFHSLPPHPEK
jgi:uncharacterized protein (TIGR03118 family)